MDNLSAWSVNEFKLALFGVFDLFSNKGFTIFDKDLQ